MKNFEAEPACTVLLLDLKNPYRYLEIRGTAAVEPDGDRAFAEQVGAKYDADLRVHDAPATAASWCGSSRGSVNAVDIGG